MNVRLSVQFKIKTELTSNCEKLDKALVTLKTVIHIPERDYCQRQSCHGCIARIPDVCFSPTAFKTAKTGDTNQTQSFFIPMKNHLAFDAALFLSLLKNDK